MKLSSAALKWVAPSVGLLALALWLISSNLNGAQKDNSLDAQFSDLGIISAQGLVPATETALLDLKDNSYRISDFKGKIVVLNLWATWCPECVREMPSFEKLQNALGTDDFSVVAIDLKESKEVVERFAQKYGLHFEILLDQDGEVGQAFNVRSIPTSYILGRNGELLGRALGAREWDDGDFITLFQGLINAGKSLKANDQAKAVKEAKQTNN
jgi:thiol-disulfide isomerase/thioredoxin